jgi:hypothetical protein
MNIASKTKSKCLQNLSVFFPLRLKTKFPTLIADVTVKMQKSENPNLIDWKGDSNFYRKK